MPSKNKKLADSIKKEIKSEVKEEEQLDLTNVISTGSTLLDLAISGGVIRGGGIPGGIIMEIYGPSSSGKTAVLAEMAGSCQAKGGDANVIDPESRFNKEYAKIYGCLINKDNYYRPDTVNEMFDFLEEQDNANEFINLNCADSLAALSTEMEMKEIDKMGMKRAKDFSARLRKYARVAANEKSILACSNQERDGTNGAFTPGGKAIPYYSSLRMRIRPVFPSNKIKKTKTINGKIQEKIIGIKSEVQITKSSLDEPYRKAIVYIVFGYGIHDVMANLIYLKDTLGEKKFIIGDEKFGKNSIDKAIEYVEKNNLEGLLRDNVISLWNEIESEFKIIRKTKKRF